MADRVDAPSSFEEPVRQMAAAVRAQRKALRLTQIALSHLAGCGPDFVYDVEAGKPTLRLDKLLELLRVLGLELVLDRGKDGLRLASSVAAASPRADSRASRPTAQRPDRKR